MSGNFFAASKYSLLIAVFVALFGVFALQDAVEAADNWGVGEQGDFSSGFADDFYEKGILRESAPEPVKKTSLDNLYPDEIKQERASKQKRGKKKDEVQEEQPVSIFADYVHYDNQSGDIFAEGSVKVVQQGQILLADRLDGNVHTGDIWTKTTTRFVEPEQQNDFTGDYVEYNYNYKTGHVYNVTGKSGTEFIMADTIEIQPEKLVGQNVMMTRCNAQKHAKCQHTTATRVDIWPNDRLIAYNASVYVLGNKVYSQKRYVTSLTGRKNQLPNFGWDKDDGFYVSQTIAFPFGSKTTAGADLFAGTKRGGRSKGWLRHDERNFGLEYSYGYYKDSDNEWIKKEHNFIARYHPKQLFDLPLRYRFWLERGRWTDKLKSSWHLEAGVYLSHDPIYLGSKSFYSTLGAGYRKLKESYNSIEQDEYRYDIGLYKNFSSKFRTGVTYSNIKNHVNIFEYNRINVSESLTYTLAFVPDDKNYVSFLQEYDLANNRVYRNRVTYMRNLHCWQLLIYWERERFTHKPYENEIHWEVHMAI